MSHVDITMSHDHVTMPHVDIIMLKIDMTYLVCSGHTYATISFQLGI